ncbi:MAG TPA: enoyl-CoA hydratase/isomerase family protein, partial [Acidimicrobiales bacterium]|nr:enoyl-CoA hydratase/isomerase family protein [Acidimicrobiales bacterium]
AQKIAGAPSVTVKMARRVIKHLAEPTIRAAMAEELIAQTYISRSDDMAELRTARAEGRDPIYTGS